MALIVTLIMLAVITFMAVTFLVLSQRQRNSVATSIDQSLAQSMTEMGAQRALAESLATVKATTNQFNYDLRVSTNYIDRYGFLTGPAGLGDPHYAGYAGVSYADQNGNPIVGSSFLANVGNLLYSPRAPVYVNGNFRFYLDLNRNGAFDTNGSLFYNYNSGTLSLVPTATSTNLGFWIGDPEWIGVLERPDLPHSSTNRFIGRFAYLVVPAGKTLDQNMIYNYAKGNWSGFPGSSSMSLDGFSRNQGVGPWEMNLAAFLADLNTNLWPSEPTMPYGTTINGVQHPPYVYREVRQLGGGPVVSANSGQAAFDAVALLRYRYSANGLISYNNLQPVSTFLSPGLYSSGTIEFENDGLDDFGSGPILTTNSTYAYLRQDPDLLFGRVGPGVTKPYPGSYNPARFFTPEDFFNLQKTTLGVPPFANVPNLTTSLLWAGAQTNALRGADVNYYYTNLYNRYTFYRMLQQLGSDSAPEPPTKLNLNYCNVDALGRVVPNLATNFIPWAPTQFLTSAVVRLLANANYSVGNGPANLVTTNPLTGALGLQIQIWPTNLYTASVHRMLQLAANIYDATTINSSGYPDLPSVFQPIFNSDAFGNIYIVNYRLITDGSLAGLSGRPPKLRDLNVPADRSALIADANATGGTLYDMVYGIPAVVGAKKGLPNFNQLAMETSIQLTRKLQFTRPSASAKVNATNQMLLLCVSNVFGLEAWNSYQGTNNPGYPRPLTMGASLDAIITVAVTNQHGLLTTAVSNYWNAASLTNIPAGTWKGYLANSAFRYAIDPLTNGYTVLSNAYDPAFGLFANPELLGFKPGQGFPVPHFWLTLRARARFYLADTGYGSPRIIDYVNLDSTQPPIDITLFAMTNPAACSPQWIADGQPGSLWCTNGSSAGNPMVPSYGVLNQIGICMGNTQPSANAGTWDSAVVAATGGGGANATANAITFFRGQFGLGNAGTVATSNTFYSPYVPTRTLYYETSWAANDPLVHYTVPDLSNPLVATNAVRPDARGVTPPMATLNYQSPRYKPWGGSPWNPATPNDPTFYDLAIKDPLITGSDAWDFPTYKLPNPGWLGRVHRGTPWQTVYFKTTPTNLANLYPNDYYTWRQWSGNLQIVTNWGQINTNFVLQYRTNLTYPTVLNALTYDALFTHPTNDYYLTDLFTTSLDDELSRGKLSVNQANLAAWSAVLSGVDVLPTVASDVIIQPAGTFLPNALPPLAVIVNGISIGRSYWTNYYAFPRLGDILRVPELTYNSPYFAHNARGLLLATNVINDEVLERIPQQILGLLKGGEQPRFVIYAYGQALKPANNSIVAGGAYSGLCTNYQITAEAATRTVVRIDGATNSPRATIESFNALPPDN